MAFGAVATGSMKAQLAARVAGTSKNWGSIASVLAASERSGRLISTVARLVMSSVSAAIAVEVASRIETGSLRATKIVATAASAVKGSRRRRPAQIHLFVTRFESQNRSLPSTHSQLVHSCSCGEQQDQSDDGRLGRHVAKGLGKLISEMLVQPP